MKKILLPAILLTLFAVSPAQGAIGTPSSECKWVVLEALGSPPVCIPKELPVEEPAPEPAPVPPPEVVPPPPPCAQPYSPPTRRRHRYRRRHHHTKGHPRGGDPSHRV